MILRNEMASSGDRGAAAGWRGRLDRLVEERLDALSDRAVGVFGAYVPLELLLALGLDPVLLTFGGSPGAMQAGEKYVRSDACPFCRSQAGEVESAPWLKDLGLIVAFSACDQERRMLETLAEFHGLEILHAAAPRTRTENALGRYVEDLEHLRAEIEFRFGERLGSAGLEESVRKVRRLKARLRAFRPRLPFADFATLAYGCFFAGVDRGLDFLGELEVEDRAPPAIRLLLAGSCAARDDLVFARELATHRDADIVDDMTRLLGGILDLDVPDDARTVESVARACFHQCDIGARPNEAYFTALQRKVEATGVDGVLFRCLKFCDVNTGEQRRIREALAPLPVLFLDDEYDAAARPRRETRVGAFMEMLRCRKA